VLLRLFGFVCVILAGAEISCRVDNWIRQDVPLSANPNRERDLVLGESWGSRGRPHGRYRKWKLDGNGFRIIPNLASSQPEEPRLLILGASETFGLYESLGKEYPAQLAQRLQSERHVRVINAAMAGITLKSLIVYWDHWAGNFQAEQVIIYPSPQFYLDNEPPALPVNPQRGEAEPSVFELRPRLVGRLHDLYHQLPAWMKRYREEWVIHRETTGKDPTWFFSDVPEDRLKGFGNDLRQLLAHVRQRGAEPILLTHARSVTLPLRSSDENQLRGMRMFCPRVTPQTLLRFEERANDLMRKMAVEEQVVLMDVDRVLSGRRELFADLFHFNDEGAAKMAELLAAQLPPIHASDSHH
jgi:hypothetical protein